MKTRPKRTFRTTLRHVVSGTAGAACGFGTALAAWHFIGWFASGLPTEFRNCFTGLLLVILVVSASVVAALFTAAAADRLFRFLWPQPPADDHDR